MEIEKHACPFVVFRVEDGLYAMNSERIATIMQLPDIQTIPDAPEDICGLFMFRGQAVPLADLRAVFGRPSLRREYEDFVRMIEERRQDHIRWVEELERSVTESTPFTLATDPHQCAFGKWYDSYQSDNNAINFHLRKIDEPHQKLHRAAFDVTQCERQCESCERAECLQSVFRRVKEEYVPLVLHLLEESKTVFRDAYREMVLVLSDQHKIGIMVDQVLSVEELSDLCPGPEWKRNYNTKYVSSIKKSAKIPSPILELNEDSLLEIAGTFELPAGA